MRYLILSLNSALDNSGFWPVKRSEVANGVILTPAERVYSTTIFLSICNILDIFERVEYDANYNS